MKKVVLIIVTTIVFFACEKKKDKDKQVAKFYCCDSVNEKIDDVYDNLYGTNSQRMENYNELMESYMIKNCKLKSYLRYRDSTILHYCGFETFYLD